MAKITRRIFLKVSAAGAGIAAMAGVKGGILNKIVSKAEASSALGEKFVNSTCRQCPGRCGIRVRVVDGKAVKIDGNPNSPINYFIEGPNKGQGGLCPKGAAGLDQLYDPDRIKGPMKRTNPKKGINIDPKFVPVSWDEALNDVAAKLKKMRAEGQAKTLLTVYGRGMGPTDAGALKAFIQLYGSPNQIGHGTLCAEGSKKAKEYLEGQKTYSVYDYDNTNYMLIFGANLLESFRPLSLSLRSYGNMRQGRARRVKMVYFDSRPSVTGAKADESFVVRPASDGAIALGMAHTILVDGLWDRSFVGDFNDGINRFSTGKPVYENEFKERWTNGLVGWWNTVLINFTPEKAAEISGIPASDIRRIAREFAKEQPGIAMFERGPTCYTTGTYNGMAIHALNGLVGSMYKPGGISELQESTPFGSWPVKVEDHMDAIALKSWEIERKADPKTGKEKVSLKEKEKKFPKLQDIPEAQMEGNPYKANVLFTWMTNPFFSSANPQRWWKAFENTFVVTFTSWKDDVSIFADYILPDPSYLESLWAAPVYPSVGFACSHLIQPAVKPLHDTRSFYWTLSELGKRMGGSMAEYYRKLGSLEDVLSAMIGGEKIGWTLDQWKEKGVWYKTGPMMTYRHSNGTFENLKEGRTASAEEIKEKVFKTPSGKFEFRSGIKEQKIIEKIEKDLAKHGIRDKNSAEAKMKEELEKKAKDVYPHYAEPEWVGGTSFDLFMNSPKMIHHAEGRGANSPSLLESFDILNNRGFVSYCWMHPDTARARRIEDEDNIIVESPLGTKVKTKALINPACHPEVVVMPFSFGHKKVGTFGYGRYSTAGDNPNELIKNLSDPESGLQSYFQTKVKVYKG
jgi:thiosulfate reductase / polysulfide reductase chain A